ncbi:MAG: hypothetical protein R3B82_11445 [Sandaracinaceae bacterium]
MSGAKRAVWEWALRLVVPLAVLIAVLAVFFGEEMSIDHEVSLFSGAARRGAPLPVRAVVLTGLERPEGPELVSLPVEVTLRATDGRTLVEAHLGASPAGGADGVLTIPDDAPDVVELRAVARLEDRGVATATRRLDLREHPAPATLEGRLAHGTAHFSEGPIELTYEGPAPSVLSSRVVGGACVPETPCEILVHVGAPAALVRFAPSPAVGLGAAPDAPTEGLARLVVTVHGPEAQVLLEAVRDDLVVARRAVRLPVALATPSLVVDDRLHVPEGGAPTTRVEVLGDRPGVIVDAWADGEWEATSSVTPRDTPFEPPLTLRPGLHLLQVRTDPFSSTRAATRFVATRDLSLDAALARLAALGADRPDEVPPGPDALRFAWSAASLETGHYELPAPIRGFDQDRAALDGRQRTLRIAALVAMTLGIVVLVLVFVRRGVDAAREAQQIMAATGDPELSSDRHRRRTLLSALLIVATVTLAFVAAGAMIVARARLLE